ncbi:MAG TPA: amidohydrolase family protein, partial [Verrucomicrobiota bacterium]|nr:amidohydrolase family protein [Verrucomicrobiota bacterium]
MTGIIAQVTEWRMHETGTEACAGGCRGDSRRGGGRRWAKTLATWGMGVVGAGVVLAGVRAVAFRGPYRPPAPLPSEPIIDLHCHAAGLGAGGSGCFVADRLRSNWRFKPFLAAYDVTEAELEREGDGLLIRRLAEGVAASKSVRAAVVLAMDGVMNDRGELDREQTEMYVPNEFVARETARCTNLWFGASIHPGRRDALERLDWAAAHGAVLVKWIPSIMRFDPAEERWVPFYERLVFHGLPLLTHTGDERAFTGAVDAYGDPERLELALRLGVTVIAAHAAAQGENAGEPNLARLRRLMARHPNLYADISALTQVNRMGQLGAALEAGECAGRLVYGTDYPLIHTPLMSPWFFLMRLRVAECARLAAIANPWDQDVGLKQALGVSPDVFQRAGELLARRRLRPNGVRDPMKPYCLSGPSLPRL